MFDIELNFQEFRIISCNTDYCSNFRDLWLEGALESSDVLEDLQISLVDAFFRDDSKMMRLIFEAEYKGGENLNSDNEALFLTIKSDYSAVVLIEPLNGSEWGEEKLNKMLDAADNKESQLNRIFEIIYAQVAQSTKDMLYKLGINSKLPIVTL